MKYRLSKYTIKVDDDSEKIILYNTFSGAIVKLDIKEYIKISGGSLDEQEIDHFRVLKTQGFIVYEGTDEFLKMREIAKNIQQNNKIDTLSYVIAPTLNCNYNCVYCFECNEHRAQTMNKKVAQDVIGFIIGQIKSLKTIKNVRVTWFGGEPLLSYDIIVSFSNVLMAKLKDLKVKYQSNMITNGLLLTKDKVEYLVKHCNLKYVQITLDGFKETYSRLKRTPEESFNIVVSNIVNVSSFAKVTIRLNTNKANYNEMKRLAKYLLEDCGLKNKIVIYLAEIRDYNNEKSDDSYKAGEFLMSRHEFKKYLFDNKFIDCYKMAGPPCFEPNFCGIIKKYNYAIGPNGELYKCEHYFGDKRKNIGDIYNGLYYNKEYKKFIEGCNDIQCINCNLAPCCRSDCGAMYECHKKNGECLIYNDLLKNLKFYIKEFVENRSKK